jgi:hypothetical protein
MISFQCHIGTYVHDGDDFMSLLFQRFVLRLPPALAEQLRAEAKQQMRSLHSYILWVVTQRPGQNNAKTPKQ